MNEIFMFKLILFFKKSMVKTFVILTLILHDVLLNIKLT